MTSRPLLCSRTSPFPFWIMATCAGGAVVPARRAVPTAGDGTYSHHRTAVTILCPVPYNQDMARWAANPRERLARAALDLFVERSYDTTTVTDIAARAGLTKSTFFRHFTDKRDVLFGGQDDMIATLTTSVAAAPPGQTPLTCVMALLDALGAYFPPEQRALVVMRSTVIRGDPELRERELLKRAQLVTAIEDALRSRGLDDLTARLTATIGMLAFEIGYDRWAATANEETLTSHAMQALNELAEQATRFGPASVTATAR